MYALEPYVTPWVRYMPEYSSGPFIYNCCSPFELPWPAMPFGRVDWRPPHSVPSLHSYFSPRYRAELDTPAAHTAPHNMPEDTNNSRYARQASCRAEPLKRSRSEKKQRPSQRTHSRVRADHGHCHGDSECRSGRNRDQIPLYDPDSELPGRYRRASRSVPRRSSTPKSTSDPKPAPKATEEDARRAGIPAGYSYKNWDPVEEPIMLLGSVFDANSLGKWIYDWTVFHYGPITPTAEMAGELWLLLIRLAGKVKLADENMSKIRKREDYEMIKDFLESGERLRVRFAKLLKACEIYMWRAAEKESGGKAPVSIGKDSGREFVDSIFGRDRELDGTEQLMTEMRLWSMRFDANCEDILRYPAA